jgi:hypothetical protein
MSAENPDQERDATFTNPAEGAVEQPEGASLEDVFADNPGILLSGDMRRELEASGMDVDGAKAQTKASAEVTAVAVGDSGLIMDSRLAANVAVAESEGPTGGVVSLMDRLAEKPETFLSTGMSERLAAERATIERARNNLDGVYSSEAPTEPSLTDEQARAAEDAAEAALPVPPENLPEAEPTSAITTKDGKPPEAPTGVPEKHLPKSPVQVVTPNVNPSMREARARAAEAAANAAEAERKANFNARNDEKRENRREAQAKRGVELRGIFKDEGGEGQTAPAIVEAMTTREIAMKHVKNRVGRVAAKLARGGQRFGNFVDRFRDSTEKDDQTYIDAMNKYSDLVNEYGSGAANFDIRAGKGADSFVASVKEESVADGEGGLSSRILFKTEPADVEFPTIEQQNRYLISDNGDVTVEAPDPQAGGEVRSKTLKPGNPGYGEIMSQLNAAIAAKTEAEENARTASDSMALAA